jgi:hypothetical protein
MPSDHNACAYSWDCTHPSSLTTSAAVASPPPISRWVVRRRRSTSCRIAFVTMWGTLVDAADEARLALLRPDSDTRRVFAVLGTAQVFLA